MSTSNAAAQRAGAGLRRRPRARIVARFYAWGTVTPVLVLVALFTLFPFFYALVTSLHRYVLTLPGQPYVGLDNYRAALSDSMAHSSATTSLIFIAVAVPLVTALGTATAMKIRLVVAEL